MYKEGDTDTDFSGTEAAVTPLASVTRLTVNVIADGFALCLQFLPSL